MNIRLDCGAAASSLALRAPLRAGATDSDLIGIIEEGLHRKRAGHAPASVLKETQKAAGPARARSMIRIGG